jgi:hypothetical protein
MLRVELQRGKVRVNSPSQRRWLRLMMIAHRQSAVREQYGLVQNALPHIATLRLQLPARCVRLYLNGCSLLSLSVVFCFS